jgi:DNA-binding beta-propeller fold protein YncE
VANCGSDSVSVIDATSLAVIKTITTEPLSSGGTGPISTCPISLASPSDGSRVVVGVQGGSQGTSPADPPQILNINTQSDTVIVVLPTAKQNSQCAIDGTTITYCPLQQPVFVTMAP